MNIYLVDFENVKGAGLQGAEELTEKDRLYIFYSENADKISFEVHAMLCSLKAQTEYFKVTVGVKNALDLQLASYLGKLIQQFPEAEFCIVTSDKVFQHLKTFWSQAKIEVRERIGLGEDAETARLMGLVKECLPEDHENWENICTCILKFKTKQAINNALVKKFGSTQGGKMYQKVKPILKDKK